MAGSEQEGIDGARPDLFVGAAWVLTPTPATAEDAYTTLRGLVRELQAEVVAVTPEDHDVLVSFVHVGSPSGTCPVRTRRLKTPVRYSGIGPAGINSALDRSMLE